MATKMCNTSSVGERRHLLLKGEGFSVALILVGAG